MPYTIAPENLRSALMNIVVGGVRRIQHVEVSRSTVNINQGFQWRVTFVGSAGAALPNTSPNDGNLPVIQLAFDTITGGVDVSGRVFEAQTGISVPQVDFPGKREVQVLVTSHPTTAVGGYFRLSYKGSAWSNYLSASITPDALKLALEALPTVGKVTVTLQGPSDNGRVWLITFESAIGNIPALSVDASKITPATAFVGVKDGDNAVNRNGVLCVPGDDVTCPGTWGSFSTGIAALAVTGEAAVEYGFYETIDANTLTYRIDGLQPGKAYSVAVTAKNALGLGFRVKSAPATIMPPLQVPSPPSNVRVDVNPGVATQLLASWGAPPSDGGSAIRMYQVQYDPSPLFKNRGQIDFWCPSSPVSAVWRVDTSRVGGTGKPIANGFFRLVITRQNQVLTTEPIPWNAVRDSRRRDWRRCACQLQGLLHRLSRLHGRLRIAGHIPVLSARVVRITTVETRVPIDDRLCQGRANDGRRG
ncbi:hypothetical protein PINS_up005108 [Pythium insidiosum]|nr:hypothetical protein PINS_up005108 [Pythium insidiosum]